MRFKRIAFGVAFLLLIGVAVVLNCFLPHPVVYVLRYFMPHPVVKNSDNLPVVTPKLLASYETQLDILTMETSDMAKLLQSIPSEKSHKLQTSLFDIVFSLQVARNELALLRGCAALSPNVVAEKKIDVVELQRQYHLRLLAALEGGWGLLHKLERELIKESPFLKKSPPEKKGNPSSQEDKHVTSRLGARFLCKPHCFVGGLEGFLSQSVCFCCTFFECSGYCGV
jgi:hypothetical protein